MDGRSRRRIVALRRLAGGVVITIGALVIFTAAVLARWWQLPEATQLKAVLAGIGVVLLGVHIIWWVRDIGRALVLDAFGLMMATFAAVPLWGNWGYVFTGAGLLLLIGLVLVMPTWLSMRR